MVAHRIKQAYDADGRLPQNHVRILHGLPLSRGQKLVQLFQPAWISTTNVFLSFSRAVYTLNLYRKAG